MRKINFFKYLPIALMMAFAMTLCYSCSSDDDEETNQEVNPPSNGESTISGTINGHAYVELAGYKWATENVGAVSEVGAKGTDPTYGYYYHWYDAQKAAASWGGKWKLPTEKQLQRLIDECNWTWTTLDGKDGYKVSSKGDGSKFIFLPAVGIFLDDYDDVLGQGFKGYCWSSDYGRCLFFDDAIWGVSYGCDTYDGMAVRLVSD